VTTITNLHNTAVVIEIFLQVEASRALREPDAEALLEGTEEPFDPSVLPGRERRRALVSYAEQAQPQSEEPGGEDGFVVGAHVFRCSEALDDVQQRSQDGDMVFEYDGAGRLIERRETLGRVTRYEYDAVGNLVSERLTSTIVDDGFVPRLTETVYDELNRPIEVRRQLGEGFVITRTKYDGEGNRHRPPRPSDGSAPDGADGDALRPERQSRRRDLAQRQRPHPHLRQAQPADRDHGQPRSESVLRLRRPRQPGAGDRRQWQRDIELL
jgi:YD repeat-containing protein